VPAIAAQLVRFLPGFGLGSLLALGVLAGSGALPAYLVEVREYALFSAYPPYRLSVWPLLVFVAERAPLHFAFTLLGLGSVFRRLVRRLPLGDALVPFAAFSVSLFSLLPNPTVFPYNLTWLAPGYLLMSALGMARFWQFVSLPARPWLAKLCGWSALAVASLSFVLCQRDPFYRKSWDGQLRVVAAAEALSGSNDPVLDLCGLVISRPPASKDWLVHSLLMSAYHAGRRETVRQIIERAWPPVAVTGHYRWGWLDASDLVVFRHNYQRFSGDIWTLGAVLNDDTRAFEIHRTGRYLARAVGDAGSIDGKRMQGGEVVWLARGWHSAVSSKRWTLLWIGPAPAPGPSLRSEPLFNPAALPGQ
jgi:hypothetical protein